jgi:hypothetical protein
MRSGRRVGARSAGLAVVGAMIASCTGPAVVHSVKEFRGNALGSIELEFTEATLGFFDPPDAGTPMQLVLGTWSHSSDNAPCPVLGPETVATLNGQVLKAQWLGSAGPKICNEPSWAVDPSITVLPTMEIEIKDHSGSLFATFVEVTTPRSLIPRSLDGGALHGGDLLAISLVPSTDVFPSGPDDMNHFGWQFLHFSVPALADSLETVYDDGGVVTVKVPAGATAVWIGEAGTAGTTRCDVGHCELPIDATTPRAAITVAP